MALKAIIDSLDDLPEDLKSEYVERDGKYELQVEGMKTAGDVSRVQEALRKEKNDFKKYKDRFSVLGDRDPNEVVELLDKIPELEAAAGGTIDESKMEQLVETRIKAKLAPVERERDKLKQTVTELSGEVDGFKNKETTRKIHDAVRKAGTAAKILPEAMDDALMLGEKVFEVDEGGKVITKDNVGVTPGLEPSSWFTDLQNSRSHWWGPSGGGGAGGNRQGGNNVDNPWSAEKWNMTQQGQILRTDASKAEQLAKMAGTTVGGPKPAPKK